MQLQVLEEIPLQIEIVRYVKVERTLIHELFCDYAKVKYGEGTPMNRSFQLEMWETHNFERYHAIH
jgi:hypothetical protein